MIIGINGYAGSGKDTIGQIIRMLTSGVVMPDKFSTERKINSVDKFLEQEQGYQIKKFANKLKQIASLLTGIPQEKFEDQEFKKTAMSYEWWTVCEEGSVPMFVREFLQKLGTDALRKGLHTNVWVNALMSEYKKNSNWVITDTRFPNEAQAIKEKNGVIIRVDRPGVRPINYHPSEIGLDTWTFDYKIANVSDLKSLEYTVAKILERIL